MRDLADRRREHRRDAGVHRVAALLQDANAGGDRVVPSGRDDAVRPEDLRPHRLDARARGRGRSVPARCCAPTVTAAIATIAAESPCRKVAIALVHAD